MLELWANNVASSVLTVCKRMQQLPTTGNNMQQGVQTGGRNMTVDKGYVHTMPDIFSCRHEKLSGILYSVNSDGNLFTLHQSVA